MALTMLVAVAVIGLARAPMLRSCSHTSLVLGMCELHTLRLILSQPCFVQHDCVACTGLILCMER